MIRDAINQKTTPLVLLLAALVAPALWAGGDSEPKRNLVLFVGDGMDDQNLTIARHYLAGQDGLLAMDKLPVRATVLPKTVSEISPEQPVYVGDSASGGTALATGAVTSRGRIATAPGTGEHRKTVLELAAAAGYGTGIVTTASVTDATPASFLAHINQRYCENPALMHVENYPAKGMITDCRAHGRAVGGGGSIAEQIALSAADLVIGGGRRHFARIAEGGVQTVRQIAGDNGFRVLEERSGLEDIRRYPRVLGLLADHTLPVRWQGVEEKKAVKIRRNKLPESFSCENNPAFSGTPTLEEMTEAALDHLDHHSDKGFFLMVESASIDKEIHRRNPCGHIGETEQLDEAVAAALAYAREHPDTLVLVTSDHGHAAQLIRETSDYHATGHHPPGYFARILNPEGSIMGIGYATNNSDVMEEHTGTQVPLLVNGVGDDLRVPAFGDQTMIFDLMLQHLAIDVPKP